MPLESRVDVFIIGAGPAGVMCANALAMAGVDVRIIDKRPVKVAVGQADGIQSRTIEVMQSYGLAERLIREGNRTHMTAYYQPGPNGGIKCVERILSVDDLDKVRYPFGVMLHQGAIEAIFLDSMRDHGVEVERPRQPAEIEVSTDANELSSALSYPVKVTVENLDAIEEDSKIEIVHAKYVIGTDGAHSWVRDALGIEMEGEQSDYIWGVIDMVPETNFPDIRNVVLIESDHGSSMIIPREGDVVRFYTQLLDADVVCPLTKRVDKNRVTPQKLVSALRKILAPFELAEPKEIQWWTVYLIGQRIASSYSMKDRVFIAGDACHTHSPQAGQGMNASMSDTHNLAWKLAQVLRGWANLLLLTTYEHERRKYAQDLIDFDKWIAALVSGKQGAKDNESGISGEQSMEDMKTETFSSGLAVQYSPSMIVDFKHQQHAKKLIIGQRMLPYIFVRAADICPVNIHDLLPADVRFKVVFFVGHLTETRVAELKLLAEELSSFLRKYSVDGNVSTVFDIITVTAGKKEDMNYLLLPIFFRPHWKKVFLDDTYGKEGGHGYEQFGIDPEQITVVVVRPDGHVGMIAPSTAIADLDKYFGSFLVPRDLNPYICKAAKS
ncbi:FAD binding domain containing protein [Tylopilus felleus]